MLNRLDLIQRILKECAAIALTLILFMASGPPAHAAESARPPETVMVDRQPVGQDTPQQTERALHVPAPAPQSGGLGDIILEGGITAAITLVVQIAACVGFGFCIFTGM